MKISVVTPSIRENGLDMVKKCLDRQTFKEYEWLVCTPYEYSGASKRIVEPQKQPQDTYSLNKCWNLLFKECQGKLVVSIVDLMWFTPDVLEKLWLHYQNNPKSCVSGFGHQYERIENGKPEGVVWVDPLQKQEQFYQKSPLDFELCLSSIPLQAIKDVGGVDEGFDRYAAMSEKEFSLRISKLGYTFWMDQSIEYRAIKHPRLTQNWDERYFAGQSYFKQCIDDIESGKKKKLDYL